MINTTFRSSVTGHRSLNALASRITFFVIVAILLMSPSSSHSQTFDILKFGRGIVDTLASPSFKGRGYIMDGDKLAADFVATEFRKLGLKEFPGAKNYYQEF